MSSPYFDRRTTHWNIPSEHPRARRGCQIRERLHRNPRTPRYCILDDDCDMLPYQRPFFVQPRFTTGLMREHVEAAITILSGMADRHPSLWLEVLIEDETPRNGGVDIACFHTTSHGWESIIGRTAVAKNNAFNAAPT